MHTVVFALPRPVARGVAYLCNPSVLLGALPSVERVIARTRGTYRLTLAPTRAPGLMLRPAAEVTFAATEDQVVIESVPEEPHALQEGEIPLHVNATLRLRVTQTGCTIDATLRLAAVIPARLLPPLPRSITQRTAAGFLGLHLTQEMQAMARALVVGFAAWERDGGGNRE